MTLGNTPSASNYCRQIHHAMVVTLVAYLLKDGGLAESDCPLLPARHTEQFRIAAHDVAVCAEAVSLDRASLCDCMTQCSTQRAPHCGGHCKCVHPQGDAPRSWREDAALQSYRQAEHH